MFVCVCVCVFVRVRVRVRVCVCVCVPSNTRQKQRITVPCGDTINKVASPNCYFNIYFHHSPSATITKRVMNGCSFFSVRQYLRRHHLGHALSQSSRLTETPREADTKNKPPFLCYHYQAADRPADDSGHPSLFSVNVEALANSHSWVG